MKIIAPSYKRAGNVKAEKYFKEHLILAVHEFEADEYRHHHPDNELMILPDSTRGNMGAVRNYIRDNVNDRHLVMLDDDVSKMGYHENNGGQYTMTLDRALEFLENGFQMAEELGTILWGVNLQSDPKFYRQYSPFSLLAPVLGTFCCHIVDDTSSIRYDERLGLNEDYDFALQVMHKYHKILRFSKYYYVADHLTMAGGCGSYRTLLAEKEQAEIMLKKWGSDVVKYNFEKSTNPRIRVPLKGI